MKRTIKLAKQLKPGDKFSQMEGRFKAYVIESISNRYIGGLCVRKIKAFGQSEPFNLTNGTHVYVELTT